jgi:hypothetical protein
MFLSVYYSLSTRWNALLPLKDDIIETAHVKLTNGETFNNENKHHVLAVVSQRLCVDLVMANVEALQLADASVARHMRLITDISSDGQEFHTHSPSEPVLVLGAVDILYKNCGWAPILDTFSSTLCDAGLVDKGLMGELAAQTLLLVARDYAAPQWNTGVPDVLKLVPVLDFFDKLFGNTTWCGQNREDFVEAFRYSYVNFTHWIVTKDPLEKADE